MSDSDTCLYPYTQRYTIPYWTTRWIFYTSYHCLLWVTHLLGCPLSPYMWDPLHLIHWPFYRTHCSYILPMGQIDWQDLIDITWIYCHFRGSMHYGIYGILKYLGLPILRFDLIVNYIRSSALELWNRSQNHISFKSN